MNKNEKIWVIVIVAILVVFTLGLFWYYTSSAAKAQPALRPAGTGSQPRGTGAPDGNSIGGVIGGLGGGSGIGSLVQQLAGLFGGGKGKGGGSGSSGGGMSAGGSSGGGSQGGGRGGGNSGGGGPRGGGSNSGGSQPYETSGSENSNGLPTTVDIDGTVRDLNGNILGTDNEDGSTFTGNDGQTYSLYDNFNSTPDAPVYDEYGYDQYGYDQYGYDSEGASITENGDENFYQDPYNTPDNSGYGDAGDYYSPALDGDF
jgi:hypothetical protein